MISIHLKEIIESALREDIGMGDLTSKSIFDTDHYSKGTFVSKAEGVLSGLNVLQLAYNFLGENVSIYLLKKDGDSVGVKERIAEVEGPTQVLL